MKFLSNEWFEAMLAQAKKEFSKPGKLTLTYCEVYNDCPGDESTKWVKFSIVNGVVTESCYGVGEAPKAEYMGIGSYANHVRICKGELNPKKAVLEGTLTLEDSIKAGPMRTIQLVGMYNKLVECKKIPGTEY